MIIKEIEFINSKQGINFWEFRDIDNRGKAIFMPYDFNWLESDLDNQILELGYFVGDIEIDDNDGFTNYDNYEEAKQAFNELEGA